MELAVAFDLELHSFCLLNFLVFKIFTSSIKTIVPVLLLCIYLKSRDLYSIDVLQINPHHSVEQNIIKRESTRVTYDLRDIKGILTLLLCSIIKINRTNIAIIT